MLRNLLIFIFLCFAALQAGPAQAGSVDRVSFAIPATVKATLVKRSPGLSQYRIVSNTGFTVYGANLIGDVAVDLTGTGSAAQMPGPESEDTFLLREKGVIYRADRRTARAPGNRRNQSVMMDIRYSDAADAPDFIFEPVG